MKKDANFSHSLFQFGFVGMIPHGWIADFVSGDWREFGEVFVSWDAVGSGQGGVDCGDELIYGTEDVKIGRLESPVDKDVAFDFEGGSRLSFVVF